MASIDLEYNSGFQIYNSDGTPFHDLVLHKCTYETVVMSLGDKISGILYYKDNALDVTMSEYIIYKGVRYTLVNPPTILREGLVSDNSELRGMTKYSFTFYHPMYVLNNFPFSDIAVQSGQSRYLSQNKTFSWIGTLVDFVAKLNKNLEDTQWMVTIGNVTHEEQTKLSEVLSFDKNTIAEALKRGYETWEVPYVVDQLTTSSPYYPEKQFVVQYGLPTTEILDEYNQPFVFQMGQGVGLKNNSRNPKNNKIITRIAGYGSEDNIPYGYPQIPYYGGNVQYPLYYGIVGGQRVQLIKHPFTRNHLMPSVYSQSVYNKVNPKLPNGNNNPNYDPTIELVDYYDANDNTYTNRIKPNSPSYEIHEFGDIKPELGEKSIISAVPVSQQETQPDYKQKSDFLQEILDRISATEIEDEKTELLDVYDRVDRGLSYYEKHGEEGGDTYWFVFSITRDDYYEYVSYESSNYNFTATMLRNGSSAPTPDWDDTMDDDGNYLQSYFKITLPILEFDLYACAAITQEMKINMRSGACIGCTFPVEVDWDDYKRNFYNSDGEFDPDGEQRDYTKYPDSSSGQITVMVKKELETFGTLMPNQYQQPTTGDKFVILGISLPNTYITSAEQRLDTDMKQYMRDNNVYYYDYPLKFDEHFLISHEDILSQMKNNVVVRFNYAGTEHALYIKQMSVKYNESPLPKYDITLTDDIEIVLNQIGQVTDEVSKLRLGFGAGGFGTVGAEYLRKDIDDTARGTIRMIKGMQVGERFVTGLLGEGGVFRKDSDGTTYLETDKLYVRMKAYFDTVEVKHYLHTGGNRIASQASGIVCSRVEMIDAYGGLAMDVSDAVLFRCFFKANDGDKTIRNDFMIGDLAFCRETNVDVSSVNLHGYWRLVVGRNVDGFLTENKEAWIDLSNRASETLTIDGEQYVCNGYQNGSDAPIAQDDIIQLGNIANKDRQGAIVEYVGGEDAPSYQIFQGIGEDLPYPYTLEDKNYIGLGYSSQTGHAYMNVYGDVFIGAKPDAVTGESPTYIKYDSADKKLTIKAVIDGSSPIGDTDTTIEQALADLLDDITDLQSQIDGSIETFFNDYMPVAKTQEGAPANRVPLVTITIDGHTVPCEPYYSWYTADHGGTAGEVNTERLKHLGDIFYDNTSGYAFRFSQNESTHVFEWVEITDSAVIKALRDAAEAYGLADTKNKIFTTVAGQLPPYPWKEGDLWVNATYPADGSIYSNDILKCKQDRTSDGSINDWTLASKYTDDKKVERYTNILTGSVQPSESSEKEIALAAENAIRTALGGNFILDGGLMLMSIIGMRKLNEGGDPSDPDDYTTWAGISGVYDDNLYGGGIAAWYGGGLVDKRNPTTGEYDVANGAKSGFRFDGSGWLADGNINWNAQGAMVIKNIETIYGTGNDSISINELSALTSIFHTETYGSGNITELLIKPQNAYSQLFINRSGNPLPASSYPQDHTINEYSVLNYGEMKARFVPLEFFNALFTAYSDANHTNAINPWTWTDTAVASRAAINNLKILVGTWTEQFLSALGYNSQQGGGGGIGDVTWEALAGAGNQQINISHLSSAGVATQSWVRSQFGSSVVRVDVGTDQYFPTGGIVSLPAYPTTLPASDVSAWAKADTKPTYAFNEITGSLTESDIPSLPWSKITTGKPTSWWGASSIDANGAVTGSMSSVGDIAFSASGKNIGGLLYFIISQTTPQIKVGSNATLVQYAYSNGTFTPKLYVDGYAGVNGEVFAKGLELVGSDTAGSEHGGYIDFHYSKSASDYTSRIIEKESGLIQLSTKIQTSRIYLYKPNSDDTNAIFIEKVTENGVDYLKVNGNLYATGAVSALGSNSQQGSGGSGNVYWSQLTTGTGGQQISGTLLSAVSNPLYILLNDEANPSITYNGRANRTLSGILTKTYADARYYQKIANGGNDEVVLADGTKSKLKTVNGYSLFGTGNIDASGGGTGAYVPLNGDSTITGNVQILGHTVLKNNNNRYALEISCGTNQTSTVISFNGYNNSENFHIANNPNGAFYMFNYKAYRDNSNGANAVTYLGSWANDGRFVIGNGGAASGGANDTYFSILGNGNVGIGTVTPSQKLEVNGGIQHFGENLFKSNTLQRGATPSTTTNLTYRWRDRNNKDLGIVEFLSDTSGMNYTGIFVCTNTDTSVSDSYGGLVCYKKQGVSGNAYIWFNANTGELRVNKIVKDNGASSQFLKADGSVDSTAYLPLSGGLMTGQLETYNHYIKGWRYGCKGYDSDSTVSYIGRGENDNNLYLVTFLESAIGFYTNSRERMLITTSGYVGIGTNQPSSLLHVNGNITASAFVKSGGTSSQFLKADGSVDSNTYAQSSSLGSYLPLTGGTITGDFGALKIKRSNSSWSGIQYLGSIDNNLGYIGVNPDQKPFFTINGNDIFYIWHSGNPKKLWGQTFNGTSDVSGAITGATTITASSNVSVGGTLGVTGNTTLSGTLGVTGATTLSSTLSVSGHTVISNSSNRYALEINNGTNQNAAALTFNGTSGSEKIQMSSTATSFFIFNYAAYRNSSSKVTYLSLFDDGHFSIGNGGNIAGTDSDSFLAVASNGNVGIGTTSPSTSLHVVGRVTCQYDSTKMGSFCATRGDYATYYGINSSGYAIITTTSVGSSSSDVRISMSPYTEENPFILIGSKSSLFLGSSSNSSNATYRDGTFIQIGGARIVWDSANTALKVVRSDGTSAANFYATGAVSAYGANTSGGGITLNEPLNGINNSNLGAPSAGSMTGTAVVFNGTTWTYSFGTKLVAASFETTTGGITVSKGATIGGNLSVNGTSTLTGNVGIGGSPNSSYKLTVGGSASISTLRIYNTGTQGSDTVLDANSPYLKLKALSTIYANNTQISSDIRLKYIRSYAGASVEQIANAPVFNFVFKDSTQYIHLGTSAQYWQNIFPCGVSEMSDTYLAMDYGAIALASAVMVARKVQNHEDRILELERENEQLRNEIKQLKAA